MRSLIKVIRLEIYIFLLTCVCTTKPQDVEGDRLIAELQLDDLELIDACEDLASARKRAFLTQNFEEKIEEEKHYGWILKSHYDVLREFTEVPSELERNWTYQIKPGDVLLPQDKWDKFVLYQNRLEQIKRQSKLSFQNQSESSLVGERDYEDTLNKEKSLESLRSIWNSWQCVYNNSDVHEFRIQLMWVKEAATLNEFVTVEEYWETLSDFPGAYEQANTLWEEIAPFYKKLQTFVRKRLFKFYDIQNGTDEIPVFLLGGGLGTDWSNIADMILPHPQLHFDVESYLKYRNVEAIYRYSENVVKEMRLGSLGEKFWNRSDFNFSVCGPQMFSFCFHAYTEIVECNEPSWPLYLNSHEMALKIALHNLDYSSLPRQQLRYCAIDDAVQILGSLLAIENLEYNGILTNNNNNRSNDDETAQMTKLLLAALRIMPDLAYSLMTDKWRMEMIENNSSDLTRSWWKYRKEYTGVEGILNEEYEYLGDSRIISNKPYISRFYGALIAFQWIAYYKDREPNTHHIFREFGQDSTFLDMIKSRHSTDWPYLLSIHYGIDLGTGELLKYFEPLERYFETAPLQQVPVVSTATTTTTKTTSIPTSPTNNNIELVNDEPKLNASTNIEAVINEKSISSDNIIMYIGIAITVLAGCLLLATIGYKKIRRKRRTNNRRFDT